MAFEFSVVIPTHNRLEVLAEVIQALEFQDRPPSFEVVVVDDGSTDGSADVARGLVAADQRVRLIRLAVNSGLTVALLAGFAAVRGEHVVTMDSDLQYDPADIPRLLALLDRYDAALGWRRRRHDTLMKRLSSLFANRVRTAVLGDAVRDSACTLRAIRRPCLAAIAPYHGMHRFVPTLLAHAGFRLIEVEVRHRPRRYGASKYGIRNRSLRTLVDLLAIRWMRSRRINYSIVESTGRD